MNRIQTQIRELAPSAREPLFRRLMVDESLAYLREKNCIIGFEVDTESEQELSGFTLIGIQKHTIYAFCSDLHETPKLILFPPLDKLFDPAFELLELKAIKRRYTNSKFNGTKIASGTMERLVKDLTPPEKKVDIPSTVAEQMAGHMKKVEEGGHVVDVEDTREEIPVKVTKEQVVREEDMIEEPPYEEPYDDLNGGFDDGYQDFDESGYGGYDSYGSYDEPGYDSYGEYDTYEPHTEAEPEPEPEPDIPKEDPRTTRLKAQEFTSLSDVSDFCSFQLGVSRPLAVNVVNKALQSNVSPEYRIALAVKLFSKLFDEKKI